MSDIRNVAGGLIDLGYVSSLLAFVLVFVCLVRLGVLTW